MGARCFLYSPCTARCGKLKAYKEREGKAMRRWTRGRLFAWILVFVLAAVFEVAATGAVEEYQVSDFDRQVVAEVNRARANPGEYARILLDTRPLYEGKRIRLGPRQFLITQEGVAALDEAVAYLRQAPALPPLEFSTGLSLASGELVADQGVSGKTGHAGSDGGQVWDRANRHGRWLLCVGENIAYGARTPQDVVAKLLVDDGVPGRGHRANIFSDQFKVLGVAHGKHPGFGVMCVMAFAGGFEEPRPAPQQ